jgi:hypothetical protein
MFIHLNIIIKCKISIEFILHLIFLHNFILIINFILSILFIDFQRLLAPIAHNVPAVYDVLPARIRALRSKDQGRQNVGEVSRGSGAQRNDLGERNPEPPTVGEA